MGEELIIRCHNCMEYRDVGKYHPANDSGRNGDNPIKLAEFAHNHMGHKLELVGEYGGTQDRWMDTVGVDEWGKTDD